MTLLGCCAHVRKHHSYAYNVDKESFSVLVTDVQTFQIMLNYFVQICPSVSPALQEREPKATL